MSTVDENNVTSKRGGQEGDDLNVRRGGGHELTLMRKYNVIMQKRESSVINRCRATQCRVAIVRS